jgi:hypothetical protein
MALSGPLPQEAVLGRKFRLRPMTADCRCGPWRCGPVRILEPGHMALQQAGVRQP